MSIDYTPNRDFIPNMRKRVAGAVDAMAVQLQADLKTTLSKSASPSAPDQPPGAETGSLRRSVQIDRSRVESDLVARVGTNLPYGRTLEYGARIRPRNAKSLAVPLTKEAKRYDSPRKFPRELTLIQRKGRAPLLAVVQKKKVTPQYVLVPSVNIAARPWLRPTLKNFIPKIVNFFKFDQ